MIIDIRGLEKPLWSMRVMEPSARDPVQWTSFNKELEGEFRQRSKDTEIKKP